MNRNILIYLVIKDARDVQFNEALVTLVGNELDFFGGEWLRRNKLRHVNAGVSVSLSCNRRL